VTLPDLLRLVARLVHVGSASVWVGGGLFYWLSSQALKGSEGGVGSVGSVRGERWAAYSRTVGTVLGRSFAALAASGAYLVFDRIANPRLSTAYIIVLAAKLALVGGIAWTLAARRRPSVAAEDAAGPPGPPGAFRFRRGRGADLGRQLIWLGAGALAFGVALTLIYEATPAAP
jgi:uncharacterized membrane protein